MRDTATPSATAALVAALRRYAKWLPPPLATLAPDPYGAAFAGGFYAYLDAAFEHAPVVARMLASHTVLGRGAATMALRTRAFDNALCAFHAAGGRQVILLGAGLDARAWRLHALRDCAVFEVDSPGSQNAKLAAIAHARVAAPPLLRFIAHDFETEGMEALPQKLRDAGLDTSAPTFTIWEARRAQPQSASHASLFRSQPTRAADAARVATCADASPCAVRRA
jgi:methyltransferase (TIGR00027 family)